MYAVIFAGGKQFRVEQGLTFNIEKLEVDEGKIVDFDKVLLIVDGENVKMGSPYLEGAKVSAEVVSHGRDKKIKIIKMHRRKHHMKHLGHRQYFTKVKITDIAVA